LNVLDLFSGIGGFSLGLERAGMRTVAFCEIDPFCRQVLAERWPDVPVHNDVQALAGAAVGPVDVICGGFPCQDISVAGGRAGIRGPRSGLWSEYARLIGELRPRYVIVENVSALLNFGLGTVLGDMAALGLDAEWHCIPASALGAPHQRDRVWVVAYAPGDRCEGQLRQALAQALDDISSQALGPWHGAGHPFEDWRKLMDQPELRRMDDGVPSTLDIRPRLHAYGNAVVPQIPEIIGRAIMNSTVTGGLGGDNG
jgi:DNA (cytosine-5)-methyltransferase 1